MSGSTSGLGWLPVEARDDLESQTDAASAEEAERLLSLSPRERVLVLMRRAACRDPDEVDYPLLRPADLLRVLDGFPGDGRAKPSGLADRYPGLVTPAEE